MTIEELNERKKKGLCFNCNEKFSPSHGCKRLFLIQANFDDSDKDIEMEIEGDEVVEQTETTPEISFHAMVGTQTPETMRVMGRLVPKVVTVLIESGSTHNFVWQELAEKVGLQLIPIKQLNVMVPISCVDDDKVLLILNFFTL